jgi:2-methylcitrate dehydratase PrpD
MLGVTASALAAGKMAGLDAAQMDHSLGTAAGLAAGLTMAFGTMAKAQNLGNAAQNGVLSALLAREGFTGPEGIFDGAKNFFASYGGHTDADLVARDLGRKFAITTNTRKIFACAGWRNPIIECSMFFADQHGIRPQDVTAIKVSACMEVKHLPNYDVPDKGLEAKFSAQYAAAVGLMDRAGGVGQFSDERVGDAALIELTRRVCLEYDATLGPFQTRMQISTNDGRELEHFIAVQKGKHLNPMSWEELAEKFRANAESVLPPAHARGLIDMIGELDGLDDVSRLTALCRPLSRT